MLHFIGDLHFGEEDIIHYDNRPFFNTKEMDKKIIDNWNETITDEDTVIVNGDFGADGYEKDILKKLKGKKILVKGNHDTKSNMYYRNCGFSEVYDYPIILFDFWIVSHEPMYVSTNSPYANIFARVHSNPMYKTVSARSYCTSADRLGYIPISYNKIKDEIIKENEIQTLGRN